VFYEREEMLEGGGLTAKVRIPLFWKVKSDLGAGALIERRMRTYGGFILEAQQVVFLRRYFSFRISAAYIFGMKEAERWVFTAGFGF
jgi:hypothetical protein